MKTFTLTAIKDFCKAHYKEYMGEATLAILFDFNAQDFTRKITFLELAEGVAPDLGGMWQYAGHDMFGDNKYVFKFKRIA